MPPSSPLQGCSQGYESLTFGTRVKSTCLCSKRAAGQRRGLFPFHLNLEDESTIKSAGSKNQTKKRVREKRRIICCFQLPFTTRTFATRGGWPLFQLDA